MCLMYRSLLVLLLSSAVACEGNSVRESSDNDDTATPELTEPFIPPPQELVITPDYQPLVSDNVTLSRGNWELVSHQYSLDQNGSVAELDAGRMMSQLYDTWMLENKYLKVTLLPGYGGRILSVFNKTTGHEELYQNPVSAPYGKGEGNFMFDWLQIVGGIFPTFGPEHGKAWNQPWQLTILKETPDEVELEMRWQDNLDILTPVRFQSYADATGIVLSYKVSLKAGRAALDTEISIHNPTSDTIKYEYWTNTALAPGSAPENTRAGGGSEIIYPLDFVSSSWCLSEPKCSDTTFEETMTTVDGLFLFDRLRLFSNWVEWGILYAWPDMAHRNFWGVINQENGEGLIRIADNSMTSGMKIWTFGYDSSVRIDPQTDPGFYRPFIELWAGNVTEFFRNTEIGPGETVFQKEVYAPTVGMKGVTHANDNFVAHVQVLEDQIQTTIFSLYPDQSLSYQIVSEEGVLKLSEPLKSEADRPVKVTASGLAGLSGLRLIGRTDSGETAFDFPVPDAMTH